MGSSGYTTEATVGSSIDHKVGGLIPSSSTSHVDIVPIAPSEQWYGSLLPRPWLWMRKIIRKVLWMKVLIKVNLPRWQPWVAVVMSALRTSYFIGDMAAVAWQSIYPRLASVTFIFICRLTVLRPKQTHPSLVATLLKIPTPIITGIFDTTLTCVQTLMQGHLRANIHWFDYTYANGARSLGSPHSLCQN